MYGDMALKVNFLGHWHIPPDVVIPCYNPPSKIVPKERKGMIQRKKSVQIIDDHNYSIQIINDCDIS